jgi:hypothetical protein
MTQSRRRDGLAKDPKPRKMSVMVLHRTKDTMELLSSIRAYKQQLASAVTERYASRLCDGESLPDYALLLELAGRDVKAALNHLIALDDKVDDAEVERDFLRADRNTLAAEEVHPLAVSVRGEIDLAFGREEGRHFHGMKGKTRRRASLLLEQLRLLVVRLKNGNPLPARRNRHARVDRERWADMLMPPYRKLEKLNAEVERLRDHVVPALILQKNAAMKAFDGAYGDALRLVTASLRMARLHPALIKKLKPYYQRRRLSQRAAKKRQVRAAAAEAMAAPAKPRPGTDRKSARIAVSKAVMQWLDKHRLFGT